MDLGVIGAGYVGLTTAACFAHLGHEVVCADADAALVAKLASGDVHLAEPDLDRLVGDGLAGGRLRFVADAADAADADVVFICVGTPSDGDGSADLSAVDAVVERLAPVLRRDAVVVNKSTVPVGTTRRIRELLAERPDVAVVSNPEFLSEGHAVRSFLDPSRVVVGGANDAAITRVADLYKEIGAPTLRTDAASAELIKYAANSFLATKISFVNAIANLCEMVGADVGDVSLGMGHDPRIGFQYLEPGPGFGGSCLPKDVRALVHSSKGVGYDFALLRGVLEVNDEQRERVVAKVRAMAGGKLEGVTVGVLGLAFKADTDDLRDSPALAIVERLVEEGASVQAYDPGVRSVDAAVTMGHDGYDAARGAAVVVVLTEWSEFRNLDFGRLAAEMEHPAIVDARNLLSPELLRRHGFEYAGIGR